jgi:hypothetical protein
MTALLLAATITGHVTYYAPGVMERVYANRLAWGHVQPCPACVGMVAVPDCRRLGERVTLQRPGRGPEGPFLVVDCGRLMTPGRIAEVDWPTARRWRMAGPLPGVTLRSAVAVQTPRRGQMPR